MVKECFNDRKTRLRSSIFVFEIEFYKKFITQNKVVPLWTKRIYPNDSIVDGLVKRTLSTSLVDILYIYYTAL